MYFISLPQFETCLLVTKDIFFELVDRLSMDFGIVKSFQNGCIHYFVVKYDNCYEYLGCIDVQTDSQNKDFANYSSNNSQ